MCNILRSITIISFALCHSIYSNRNYIRLYDFTDEQIEMVVDEHNRLRALEPASNMQKMVWDQRLADVSKQLASTCLAQHSHPSYRWSKAGFRQIGESLWWRYEHHMRRNVRWFVQDLYNEKPFYNFDADYCRPREMCGHYKQVVWANSCAIGCAAAYCRRMFDSLKNAWYTGHLVVCHYGPAGNYPTRPYIRGRQCGHCPGQCEDGLCPSQCTEYPARNNAHYVNKPKQYTNNVSTVSNVPHWCKDRNRLCGMWASVGECVRNPLWMTPNCPASCNKNVCSK